MGLWDWIDRAMIGVTIYYSAYNYLVMKKNNDDISIILTCEGKADIKLEQTIKRKNVTRSEIQGILGNYYFEIDKSGKPNNKYNIDFLKTKEYFDKLIDIQSIDRKHIFPFLSRCIFCTENTELPKQLSIKVDSKTYDGFSGKNRSNVEDNRSQQV